MINIKNKNSNKHFIQPMKKQLLTITTLVFSSFALSQVGINTAYPKTTLDISAVRENGGVITDNSQLIGLQVPSLTREELTANTAVYGNDQKGALLFITDISGGNSLGQRIYIESIGYYYFDSDNDVWQKFSQQPQAIIKSFSVGDITHSVVNTDYEGWYLLDGRAISSLPVNARTAASSLGLIANLPDATNRVLKTKTGTEVLGNTGGNSTLTIARTNLPSFNIDGTVSGSTNVAGNHSHSAQSGYILFGGTSNNNNGTGHYAPFNNVMFGGIGSIARTNTSGAHTHSVTGTVAVPTGGSGNVLNNVQPYLAVNTFIYLGQ